MQSLAALKVALRRRLMPWDVVYYRCIGTIGRCYYALTEHYSIGFDRFGLNIAA